MNLNQNDSISSDITTSISQISFRCSYYRREVQLQFRDQSQHLLESMHLQSIDNLKESLTGYAIKSVQENKITFEKERNCGGCEHGEFIKKIQEFFSNYKIIIIWQSCSSLRKLADLRQRLCQVSDEIGVSKEHKNARDRTTSLYVFYPRGFQKTIRQKIEQYKLLKQEKVFFSLNYFIKQEINSKYFKDFVGKLENIYHTQLTELCKNSHNQRKSVFVNILKVSPNIVSRQHASQQWTRKEKRLGMIGIQFEIIGPQSQFLRFYSLVEQFFSGINYTIKKVSDIVHYHQDIQTYLLKNRIKFAMLKEKVVIFQPPQNLDEIIKQLGQKTWTLTAKDFLNLPFSLLSMHKKVYLARLRSKSLIFSNINVQSDSIEFSSNQNTYDKIKSLSRQFLYEMNSQEKWLPFIESKEDLQIIKKVYLPDRNFQLVWKNNHAFIQCPFKDLQQNHKQMVEISKKMSKKRVKIYSNSVVKNELVRVTKKAMKFSFFRSESYQSNNGQFDLNIRQQNQIEQESQALFLYNKQDNNSILINILKRNCKEYHNLSSYDMKEISTQYEPNLQFIFILQLPNPKNCPKKQESITILLQEFITRKKPFKIVMSCKVEKMFIYLLRFILKHLQFRKSQIEDKRVFFFIPAININTRFLGEIKIILQQLYFVRVNKYLLSTREMLIARNLPLVSLTCNIKKRNVACTSLNGYIFQCEIESNKKKQFQFGLFVPKIPCKQYLVNLKIGCIYRINHSQVQKVSHHSHLMEKTVSIFKKYFSNQNYAVVCCNEDGEISFPSSMFVYKSEYPSVLRKARIDYQGQKLTIVEQYATYSTLYKEECFYLLETDKQISAELYNLLQK